MITAFFVFLHQLTNTMDTRFGTLLKTLRRQKGLTQEEFASALGVKRSKIGAYEENRAMPKLDLLKSIAVFFNVSIEELVNATGAETQNLPIQLKVLTTVVDTFNKELITLVPEKAAAGYLHGYSDPEYVEQLPRFTLPVPELSAERTYRAFQISGDSMFPIPSGSYILCDYVENLQSIREGKPYILVTRDEGIVYKRIWNDDNSEKFLLQSDNPVFTPYFLPKDAIIEAWRALGYLCMSLP